MFIYLEKDIEIEGIGDSVLGVMGKKLVKFKIQIKDF